MQIYHFVIFFIFVLVKYVRSHMNITKILVHIFLLSLHHEQSAWIHISSPAILLLAISINAMYCTHHMYVHTTVFTRLINGMYVSDIKCYTKHFDTCCLVSTRLLIFPAPSIMMSSTLLSPITLSRSVSMCVISIFSLTTSCDNSNTGSSGHITEYAACNVL